MMGGDAVEWAATAGEELHIAIHGDPANQVAATHLDTDEALWNNICISLKNHFSEYHGMQSAFKQLEELKQARGQVEDYINQFERLRVKADWGRNDAGTMIAFKKGLDPGLLKACFAWRPQPLTLQDWFDAAAEEEKIFDEQQFAVEQAKKH